ncbi:RNA binding motif protein 22, partial [Mortierella sp. NVP41]
ICQACSKVKNVCQTCLFDLEFGLPVQVRETAFGLDDNTPRSTVSKEYFAQNMDAHFQYIENELGSGGFGRAESTGREMLKKLQRTEPYYMRNRQHICSFFVKGNCTRGAECPYRHEMPIEGELKNQNLRDRSITSLFISGLTDAVQEKDLKGFFYVFGEIKSVVVARKSNCAFINFATRTGAELAF